MNKFFSQLKNEADKIRLSPKERELILRSLEEALASRPLVKSPIRVTPSPYLFISSRLVSPLAFILILTIVGGGTAYAAEAAVPGDVLYSIKVNINEKVVAALASSSEAKAEVHAKLAERRMQEAEALVERAALTPEVNAELEERLERHAAEVDAATEALEREDPITAADISSRLESVFTAHGVLIARLGEEADEVSRNESEHLSRTLKERGRRIARAGEGLSVMAERSDSGDIAVQTFAKGSETAITASVTLDTDDPVSIRLGRNASTTLEEAEARLNTLKNINASTAARVKAQIEKTRERVKNFHGQGKEGFEKALKDAETLKVFIEAQEKFQERELLPSLEIGEEDEEDEERDGGKNDSSGQSLQL